MIAEIHRTETAFNTAITDKTIPGFIASLGLATGKVSAKDQRQLRKRLHNLTGELVPYQVALLAISGKLPPPVAFYVLTERMIHRLLTTCGKRLGFTDDAFRYFESLSEKVTSDPAGLKTQPSYSGIAANREALFTFFITGPAGPPIQEVLSYWFESPEGKNLIHHSQQYPARAANFLLKPPKRFTTKGIISLTEQYRLHAILLTQELRLLIALNYTAAGKRRNHDQIQEQNFESLLNSDIIRPELKSLAAALDRRIRNAIAHGAPEINWAQRVLTFRDRQQAHELSFSDFVDQVMGLATTAVCLFGSGLRLQHYWIRAHIAGLR